MDTVIDVTSSLEETYERIVKLMEAGKNIVTANKAVVSKYFEELNELAREKIFIFLMKLQLLVNPSNPSSNGRGLLQRNE
ncbi:hypothetical protein [Peptoniphilus harei]|uniref:hypothetical protein n=1 Tax=Peptoniphilus harei TaxID=54005 RepID=UPI0021151A0B|nr:hypothetical protein [Peptoniphilus harei]